MSTTGKSFFDKHMNNESTMVGVKRKLKSHSFRYIEDLATVGLDRFDTSANKNFHIRGTTTVTGDMLEYIENNHLKTKFHFESLSIVTRDE